MARISGESGARVIRRASLRALALAALATTALTPAVYAQDETAAAAASDDEMVGDEEVTVTAERKSTSIMVVPQAIQVTSGEVLKALHITTVSGLSVVVPTFNVSRSYQGAPQFAVRGIVFNAVNMSSSPTVVVYQNDVAFAYPYLLNGPMFDMQSVEVLKGPQGTLYGRNTTAGLLKLIPNAPADEFEAGFAVDIGNYDTRNYEFFISGPITDTLRFRISGRIEDSNEGWQKYNGPDSIIAPYRLNNALDKEWLGPRPDSDKTLGEIHNYGGRFALNWTPTSALTVDLVGSMWYNGSDTQAAQGFALTPNNRRGASNATVANYVAPPLLSPPDPNPNPSLYLKQIGYNQPPTGSPKGTGATDYFDLAPYGSGKDAGWLAASKRCGDGGVMAQVNGANVGGTAGSTAVGKGTGMCGALREDSLYLGGSLKIGYQISDDLKLTSITGYNHLDRESLQDSSGAALELLIQNPKGELETFSQELRLEGVRGPVSWTVAAYYGRDEISENIRSLIGDNANSRAVVGFSTIGRNIGLNLRDINTGLPIGDYAQYTPPQGFDAFGAGFRTLRDTGEWEVSTKSISGSIDWKVTETLNLIAGVRYTQDYTKMTGCTRDVDGNSAAGANTGLLNIMSLRLTEWQIPVNYVRPNDCLTLIDDIPSVPGEAKTVRAPNGTMIAPSDANRLRRGEITRILDEDNFAWRFALTWRPQKDLMFYASASKGAKQGVIPLNTSSSELQFTPVTQEIVYSYEVGGRWRFGEGGGFLSLGGFYYDYTDKQLYTIYMDPLFGPLARIANVPESHAFGVEAEFNLPLSDWLDAYGSATYLQTNVDEFIGTSQLEASGGAVSLAAGSVPVDLAGARFPYAPTWALNAGLRFEAPVGTYRIGGSVNYRWQSSTIASVVESALVLSVNSGNLTREFNFVPDYTMAGYGLVSANVGFGPEDGTWELSIWARNLLDEDYAKSVVANGSLLTRYMGEPRTAGATFRYNF